MPKEAERTQAIEQLRQALDGILDWNTVQYHSGKVMMHT